MGWGGQVDHAPQPPLPLPTSIPEPNKAQKFQLQTSRILLFTDIQKLCRIEISQLYCVCYNFGLFLVAFHCF